MGKILLVEDDNNLREIYGARLQAEGHEIVSARDGEEALAIAVKEKPDLILADIMMPRISGFDMLDILRNAPETKNTKIIMMTALSQQEDKEHAKKLGADKYLVKSQVTLEDVAKIVRETLAGDSGDGKKPAASEPDEPKAEDAPKPSGSQLPADDSKKPADTDDKPVVPLVGDTVSAQPAASTAPATDTPQPVVITPAKPSDPTDDVSSSDSDTASSAPTAPSLGSPPIGEDKPAGGSSISIPVVEPAEPPKQDAVQPPTSAPPTPQDEAKDKTEPKTVGPNLAQALAEEEKQVEDKIKDFEKNGPKDAPAESPPQPQVISPTNRAQDEAKPSEPSPTEDNAADKDGKDKPAQSEVAQEGPLATDGTANRKKIIQPINDLSKKPDLQAMADKEEAEATAAANVAPDNAAEPQMGESDKNEFADNQPKDITI